MNVQKRVAVYARVSTKEQTCENQLKDLREYAIRRNWLVVDEFVDAGVSGAKLDRPRLNDCMGFLRKRNADMLLVWRFDRFARSLSHLVATLQELRNLEIDFISYQENVDTSSAQGRMVFGFMASLAEFERELIRERVLSGLRRAKAQGVELGRPNLDPDKLKEILSYQGMLSQRAIAEKLGVGKGTVQRAFAVCRADGSAGSQLALLEGPDLKPHENVAFITDDVAVAF
jgi:DNA invertase Pin-like site-specific DNA recombinase